MATGNIETELSTISSAKYGKDMRAAIRDGLAIASTNIYGGNSLGTSITSDQINKIKDGTFDGLHIGDYWTNGDITYRIADFDYWYNQGDTAFTKHHIVVVNDPIWTDGWHSVMNETNIVTGGYTGSYMYTTTLPAILTKIQSAFGSDYVLSHREYLTNAASSSTTGGAWFDSYVEIMNEPMVYGCHLRSAGGSDNITIDNSQLKLFTLNHNMINPNRQWYWLRDVVSSTAFAVVAGVGLSGSDGASNDCGVRVAFAVGA